MNKLLLAALILSLSALAYLGYKQYEDDDYGSRPAIADSANHNNLMNECVKLSL